MGVFYAREIVEVAIQIEKNGRAFYTAMEGSVEDPELKGTYAFLAREEAKHIERFSQLGDRVKKGRPGTFMESEEYGLYLEALADEHVFRADGSGEKMARKAKGKIGGLDIGIQFEKDTILFFEELCGLIHAKDRSVIDRLISEEKAHLKKLLDMKKKRSDKAREKKGG